MLHLYMSSRVFSFISLTLGILFVLVFFFCFRNFSVTRSSAMKKIWRRSWQCSKVSTEGFSSPVSAYLL